MTATLDDARIRLVIDAEGARRSAEQQEKERGKRGEKRKRRDARRERRDGASPSFPTFTQRVGDTGARLRAAAGASSALGNIGRVAAGLSFFTGAAFAGAIAAEQFGPAGVGALLNALPPGPLRDAIASQEQRITELAQVVTEVRAGLAAVFQTKEQLGAVFKSRALFTEAGQKVSIDDFPDLAVALFEVNRRLEALRRSQEQAVRVATGRAVGGIGVSELEKLLGGSSGANR